MVKQDVWMYLYPQLADKDFIVNEIKDGKTRKDIATMVGCDVKTLRKALTYHSLAYPYMRLNDPLISVK